MIRTATQATSEIARNHTAAEIADEITRRLANGSTAGSPDVVKLYAAYQRADRLGI